MNAYEIILLYKTYMLINIQQSVAQNWSHGYCNLYKLNESINFSFDLSASRKNKP